MGGLLHFLDFNHVGRSRKLMRHKRHTDGVEAPRNSMEFPSDTSPSHRHVNENIPFSCQVKHPSEVNLSSSGIPMKKLIDEEMTKQVNSIRSAPSVVARLMGMDVLPSEAKSSANSKGKTNDPLSNQIPRKTHSKTNSGQYETVGSIQTKQRTEEPHLSSNINSTKFNQSNKSTRPRPREHPQEEILQKFKKEFEAWQAKKMSERTKAVGLNSNPQSAIEKQSSAQGKFKKEKMVKHADANWEPINYISTATLNERNRWTSSTNEGPTSKRCQFNPTETMSLRSKTRSIDSEHLPIMKSIEKNESSSSPTRIVVLKPGSENSGDTEEAWPGSSANAVQKEVSMEDFLEEVRNRLRMEIDGKSRSSTTRGSTTDVFSRERLTGPRQIAQNIARQIRESVTRDIGTGLTRSESIRSCKSEIQHSDSDSPEFINRDTRKVLTERLKNTLTNEEDAVASRATSGRTRTPAFVKEGNTSRSRADAKMLEEKVVYWEDNGNSIEGKTRSFREWEENGMTISAEMSPRNLVRSLSAPVSGPAFGKLIVEDQHVLTGAHIQRKHEVTDNYSISSRKTRKDHFDFKGRVSNLRHNLTVKGKLFGRKVHLAEKTDASDSECAKDIETVPSCVMNMGTTQTRLENPTEVPPSPASVSSNSYDDLCKPGHPSPVSPLDLPFIEENQSPQISKDISCAIPQASEEISCDIPLMSEEKSCDNNEPNPHEMEMSEELEADKKIYENKIIDVGSHEEAYVREILITADLYERESARNALLRWEVLSQTLPKWVFEEVEETFCDKHEKVDNDASTMSYEVTSVDRKMLFDLVKEALPFAVKPFINGLGVKRCLFMTVIPHGKKLFEDVLNQIQILTHLPDEEENCTLESMAAHDVKKASWITMMLEGTDEVGTEVELLILRDLVEESVLELYYD